MLRFGAIPSLWLGRQSQSLAVTSTRTQCLRAWCRTLTVNEFANFWMHHVDTGRADKLKRFKSWALKPQLVGGSVPCAEKRLSGSWSGSGSETLQQVSHSSVPRILQPAIRAWLSLNILSLPPSLEWSTSVNSILTPSHLAALSRDLDLLLERLLYEDENQVDMQDKERKSELHLPRSRLRSRLLLRSRSLRTSKGPTSCRKSLTSSGWSLGFFTRM